MLIKILKFIVAEFLLICKTGSIYWLFTTDRYGCMDVIIPSHITISTFIFDILDLLKTYTLNIASWLYFS